MHTHFSVLYRSIIQRNTPFKTKPALEAVLLNKDGEFTLRVSKDECVRGCTCGRLLNDFPMSTHTGLVRRVKHCSGKKGTCTHTHTLHTFTVSAFLAGGEWWKSEKCKRVMMRRRRNVSHFEKLLKPPEMFLASFFDTLSKSCSDLLLVTCPF